MKFSLAASTLGLAALALAAPAEFEVRGGGGGGGWSGGGGGGGGGGGSSSPPPSNGPQNNCASSQSPVCCENSNCYVSGSGGGSVSCSNSDTATVKCCQTNSSPGSFININALDCVDLGGGSLSVPITL